jgi:hypothetical protein
MFKVGDRVRFYYSSETPVLQRVIEDGARGVVVGNGKLMRFRETCWVQFDDGAGKWELYADLLVYDLNGIDRAREALRLQ